MSLEASAIIFNTIMAIGLLVAVYFLVKDRIEIIRSIKPDSLADFFGFHKYKSFLDLRGITSTILFNIIGLIIWVPFWVIDKIFKLNIFEENNKR